MARRVLQADQRVGADGREHLGAAAVYQTVQRARWLSLCTRQRHKAVARGCAQRAH